MTTTENEMKATTPAAPTHDDYAEEAEAAQRAEAWPQAAEHLEEIREGIEELLADAEMTLDECDCGIVARRAKSYWLAHIADALGIEGKFAMCTMRDTIQELTSGDTR